jgi:predicted acetyltransferase
MTEDEPRLTDPTEGLEDEFLDMVREYRLQGERRYEEALSDFRGFVRRLRLNAQGVDLAKGHVPSNTYWLVGGGRRVLGVTTLRHQLNSWLMQEGGHIGYNIRPAERRKGYGTLILKLCLEKARLRGLRRALVTCDTDNIASAKIIRKNGGQFDGEATSPVSGKAVSRYWIDLAPPAAAGAAQQA